MSATHLNEKLANVFLSSIANLVAYVRGCGPVQGIMQRMPNFAMSADLAEQYDALVRTHDSVELSLTEKTGSIGGRIVDAINAVATTQLTLAQEVVDYVRNSVGTFDSRIARIETTPKTFGIYGRRLRHELRLFIETVTQPKLYPDAAVRSFTIMNEFVTMVEAHAQPERRAVVAAAITEATKVAPSVPKPDNKSGKRLRDQVQRTAMRGSSEKKELKANPKTAAKRDRKAGQRKGAKKVKATA